MEITIESLFKRPESEALCHEVVEGRHLAHQCARFIAYAAAGGAIYGFTMGLTHSWLQAVSSAAKVFSLFLVYMFIGAQMSYLLSPWVQYDGDFVFFLSSKGDFFSYVFGVLVRLLSP